jgi:hypothetical protein
VRPADNTTTWEPAKNFTDHADRLAWWGKKARPHSQLPVVDTRESEEEETEREHDRLDARIERQRAEEAMEPDDPDYEHLVGPQEDGTTEADLSTVTAGSPRWPTPTRRKLHMFPQPPRRSSVASAITLAPGWVRITCAIFLRWIPRAIPDFVASGPAVSELYWGEKCLHVCPKIANLAPRLERSTHALYIDIYHAARSRRRAASVRTRVVPAPCVQRFRLWRVIRSSLRRG